MEYQIGPEDLPASTVIQGYEGMIDKLKVERDEEVKRTTVLE